MEETEKYVVVSEAGIRKLLPASEIVYLQSHKVYTIFHLKNKKQYVGSQNIGVVHSKMDKQMFLRIHKSHVVNVHEVKVYYNARGGKVLLSNNEVIVVAQRRKTELLKSLARLHKKQKTDPRIITTTK